MKLLHSEWEFVFEFQENSSQALIIENPKTYRDLIVGMKQQCAGEQGGFILNDKEKELPFNSKVVLVTDPLSLDMNSRKALTALYKIASSIAQDESHYLRTQEIKGALSTFLEELFYEFHYPIAIDQEIEVEKIFKAFGVSFDYDEGNLAECLSDYTRIMSELAGIRLFAFCGLTTLFDTQELTRLLTEWQYSKTSILLIESREFSVDCSLDCWIIDGGDCLIKK